LPVKISEVINFFDEVKFAVDFIKESLSIEFFKNHLSCLASDSWFMIFKLFGISWIFF
jgi:hypothetical protein